MDLSPTTNRLIQAQARAESDPRPTVLWLYRDGIEVEMWQGGRRVTKRVSWLDIERARHNPLLDAIDACVIEFNR